MSIISPKPIGRPSALLEQLRKLPPGGSIVLPWNSKVVNFQSNVMQSCRTAGIEVKIEARKEGEARSLKVTRI